MKSLWWKPTTHLLALQRVVDDDLCESERGFLPRLPPYVEHKLPPERYNSGKEITPLPLCRIVQDQV